jgi:lysophospholipid acyltransferase (LPLAT)-like uncharacterized protein
MHTGAKVTGWILGFLYLIFSSTFRFRYHFTGGYPGMQALRRAASTQGHIFALWHQDDFCSLALFRKSRIKNMTILISSSRDGTILDGMIRRFGATSVRGSSTRGAMSGFRQLYRRLTSGCSVVFALDGPRGPAFRAKNGASRLSNMTGCPIVPFRCFPRQSYTFEKAWNRTRLPLPFARIDVVFGRPGRYEPQELTETLNSLTPI